MRTAPQPLMAMTSNIKTISILLLPNFSTVSLHSLSLTGYLSRRKASLLPDSSDSHIPRHIGEPCQHE